MGSLGSPKTWIPYMNSKDCLQGFCSIYCPQWCYIISSPPPPVEFSDENHGPNFSPLVVAIIGILASAFLLVSYYTIISKYCEESNRSGRRENGNVNGELDDNLNLNLHQHEPWQASSNGVEEALINSIAVCKYKRGDGLVEITECSVCLSEFEEDEEFRLLPKCSHAFHLPCIDKWLRAHSNCPLCRANIFSLYSSLPLHSLTSIENPPSNEPNAETHLGDERESIENSSERQDSGDEIRQRDGVGELGNPKEGDVIIGISDGGFKPIRRSVSLDHSSRNRDLAARVLNSDRKGVEEIGSSKQPSEEGGEFKFSHKKWILDCVVSPVPMKRSFSSGRFLLARHGGGSSVLPV